MLLLNLINTVILLIGTIVFVGLLAEAIAKILIRYFTQSEELSIKKGTLMDPDFEKPDSYKTEDAWYEHYCKELEEMFPAFQPPLNKWEPLCLWSAPRYHGKFINVDKYNLRRTIRNHEQALSNIKPIIYFFGGSTTWGWGARDEYTIPSQLSSLRKDVFVENHAQLGYVFAQETIAFIQRLRDSQKPDVVIFFNGLNDIYSAYQAGITGVEMNALSRKERLEFKGFISLREFYKQKSNMARFMEILRGKKQENKNKSKIDYERLAREVISVYNSNVELIRKIAAAYDIKPIFIWQPVIFDKSNLTDYEQSLIKINMTWKPLYSSIKTFIQTEDVLDKDVLDWSDLFSNIKEPIYIDPMHYNEYANSLIAKKINEVLVNGMGVVSQNFVKDESFSRLTSLV